MSMSGDEIVTYETADEICEQIEHFTDSVNEIEHNKIEGDNLKLKKSMIIVYYMSIVAKLIWLCSFVFCRKHKLD